MASEERAIPSPSGEPPPPGWGKDRFTAFLDMARGNLFASFYNLAPKYAILRTVDEAYLALIEGWKDPEDAFAAPLAIRCHSAFRVAAQLSMSGQLPEAFMVARGCLEHALYANHINARPDAWTVWTQRGRDQKAKKACIQEFATRRIFDSLRERDTRIAEIAGALYERAIEFGAHPNELAVAVSTEMFESHDGVSFEFSYLAGDGLAYQLCHKSVIQTGLVALDTLCLVFPERCRALRIQERVAAVKTQS